MIHLANTSEERNQSGSLVIELFNQARERRQREGLTALGKRTKKLSFVEQTNLPYPTDCIGKSNLFLLSILDLNRSYVFKILRFYFFILLKIKS